MWQYNYSYELYHYGVPGMKWGHRKARQVAGSIARRRQARQDYKNTPEGQAAAAKRKKAMKVGAAVVGTALAAYGTYKLAQYAQDKRHQAAMKKANDYVKENFLEKYGYSTFADGRIESYYKNARGELTIGARGSKDVGKLNAKVISDARKMYDNATNTKLDKGLSKVVNAGDSVGTGVKKAGQAVGSGAQKAGQAARTAKNKVLDAVNPMYEYTRGTPTTKTYTVNGMTIKETTGELVKRKVKRR